MAFSFTLPSINQGHFLRSRFIGRSQFPHRPSNTHPTHANRHAPISAKFDPFQILGGRGLCNGEEGLQKELSKNIERASPTAPAEQEGDGGEAIPVPENGFEKELMGLTGGFPGGEKGLNKFIEENPPPKKQSVPYPGNVEGVSATSKKPKAPELPLLMPGMIAIVKNPNNPFYMYCGIVQRITDGKAGVLFEGGNWDRLITFRLDELQRRDKGPPMKNPKSAVLETMIQRTPNDSSK